MEMDKLHILWTTDNRETLFRMLAMYAINAKINTWWEQVNVIIWGPSAKLVKIDPQVQTEILEILANGVTVEACKDCADQYEATEVLIRLGVNVRFMGKPLTDYIKAGEKILSI
jgi:hypothetical protein